MAKSSGATLRQLAAELLQSGHEIRKEFPEFHADPRKSNISGRECRVKVVKPDKRTSLRNPWADREIGQKSESATARRYRPRRTR
jgi:hypothetical protein